ncbi:MAG: hypothetical protein JRG91_20755 [Deltaproteobacteria bacterium]|nr:hypothetical protein [Deltaproteobacteria bacterium]
MASLQIRDVDPVLIERIKELAKRDRRTLGQQVQYILERYIEAGASFERRDLATAARRIRAFWKARGIEAPEIELPSRSDDDDRMQRIQRILDGEECSACTSWTPNTRDPQHEALSKCAWSGDRGLEGGDVATGCSPGS